MLAAGENFWHFEIVKTGFTRGNARRRRKKIGTFRLPQAKKFSFWNLIPTQKLIPPDSGTFSEKANSSQFQKLIPTQS